MINIKIIFHLKMNRLFMSIKNWFKKLFKKQMSWNDITLRQAIEIREAGNIKDETEQLFTIASIVFGNDVMNLSVKDFKKKCSELNFIGEDIPTDAKFKTVKVNGHKYYFDGLLGNISTAQYMDFQNWIKRDDEVNQFSVFFIPKGHKYNDGYDMLQVIEDIKDMPIPVVTSASFFFKTQFETFIKIFQRYSLKQLKKTPLPKEVKKNLETVITNSVNLEFYHLFQNFVK